MALIVGTQVMFNGGVWRIMNMLLRVSRFCTNCPEVN
jgi:hypothetical protein